MENLSVDEIFEMVSKIDAILKKRKIPKMTFYNEVDITSGAFSQWKAGTTTPKYNNIKRIADYLDVPIDYLLPNEKKTAIPEDSGLSADEAELIQLFLALSPEEQDRELAYLRELSQRHEGEKEK